MLSEYLAERTRARARRRARPRPRARAARCARPAPERDAAPRRRASSSTYEALDPAPTQGRRQPALRRRRDRDPAHDRARVASRRWVAMVQKEVGERFAAAPGTLGLRRAVACSPSSRATSRSRARSRATSSHPVPNVDSVLVGLKRHGPAPPLDAARARPAAASRTAARRSRARWRSRPARRRTSATRTRAALEALGRPADARAETLAAARTGARSGSALADARAPGKVNLCLLVGAAARRRLPPARLGRPAHRARGRADARARPGRDDGRLPGRRGREPRAAGARASSARRPAGTARRCGSRSTSGSRRGRHGRAARPTPRPRCGCCSERVRPADPGRIWPMRPRRRRPRDAARRAAR